MLSLRPPVHLEPVTPEKLRLKTDLPYGLAAVAWSNALALEGRQSPLDNVEAIRGVKVADVNRVARQCLDLNQAITAILTPEPGGKPVTAKGFVRQEVLNIKPTERAPLPEWASQRLNRLAVPVSTVHPVVTTLANGIKLMVQPESGSNSVIVLGHFKNEPNLQTPPGQEGVDQVLDQLFSYGATTLDRLAFQKAQDEIAAEVSAGTSFVLKVLSDHFERGVELLADNEVAGCWWKYAITGLASIYRQSSATW